MERNQKSIDRGALGVRIHYGMDRAQREFTGGNLTATIKELEAVLAMVRQLKEMEGK